MNMLSALFCYPIHLAYKMERSSNPKIVAAADWVRLAYAFIVYCVLPSLALMGVSGGAV